MPDDGVVPADEAERRRLVAAYVERHNAFENWSLAMAGVAALARALGGVVFRDARGHAALWASFLALLLVPALGVTAWAEAWDGAAVGRWVAVAAGWSLASVVFLTFLKRVNRTMLSLHGALADPASLRRLIAWDLRWFRYPVVAALAAGFVAVAGGLYVLFLRETGSAPVHPGALAFVGALLLVVGEVVAALILLVAEYPMLAAQRYRLDRRRPLGTPDLTRALRGYNAFTLGASGYLTLTIVATGLVLPAESPLVLPLAGSLLALSYVIAGLVVLGPRLLISSIARREKERTLAPIVAEINALWDRVGDLDADEYQRFLRLEKQQDTITEAPASALDMGGALGYFLSSVLLPTIVAVLAAVLRGLFDV